MYFCHEKCQKKNKLTELNLTEILKVECPSPMTGSLLSTIREQERYINQNAILMPFQSVLERAINICWVYTEVHVYVTEKHV